MKEKIIGLACVLGLLFPGVVTAQNENGDDGSLTRLEEVMVTAHRFEEPVQEVNANITVLDEQAIRMSNARDLGELLAEENIGHIEKTPGSHTAVGIRGFRSNALGNDLQGGVIILLDGRRVGTGNVSKIMTENIERIEIIRGPASVQYGSAAVGGAINIITRQGQGEPTFFAEGKLGSFGYEAAGAGFSGKINGFDFSGAAGTSTRDDYYTAAGKKYDNTGYDEKKNISLNLGYEFVPNNRIGFIYTLFETDKAGSPYYLSQVNTYDTVDNSNESFDFSYSGETGSGLFSWQARYFTGKDEYDYHWSLATDKTDTDHKGAQAQLTWSPGQYALTAGVDWVNYEIEQDYAPLKTEYDNPSYYLLGKAKYLDDRLILSGGLRYDEYEVEVKEGQGGTEKDDNVSLRVGAGYFLLERLKLRANYGQAFRMPSARELAGDYVDWGVSYRGNPDLDPEKSDTYELGLDWYHRLMNASLTYFHTDFKDKIDLVSTSGGVHTWMNSDESTVAGFEGALAFDLASIWNWNWSIRPYCNFTYLTEYENDKTGQDLLYTSDLMLSYGLTVSDFDGFLLRVNFAYTGKQYIQDYEEWDWMTMASPAVVEKSGFTVAGLSIEKRLVDFKTCGDLTLRGEIQNLLDKDYAYVKGYPMEGRNFALSLKYTY